MAARTEKKRRVSAEWQHAPPTVPSFETAVNPAVSILQSMVGQPSRLAGVSRTLATESARQRAQVCDPPVRNVILKREQKIQLQGSRIEDWLPPEHVCQFHPLLPPRSFPHPYPGQRVCCLPRQLDERVAGWEELVALWLESIEKLPYSGFDIEFEFHREVWFPAEYAALAVRLRPFTRYVLRRTIVPEEEQEAGEVVEHDHIPFRYTISDPDHYDIIVGFHDIHVLTQACARHASSFNTLNLRPYASSSLYAQYVHDLSLKFLQLVDLLSAFVQDKLDPGAHFMQAYPALEWMILLGHNGPNVERVAQQVFLEGREYDPVVFNMHALPRLLRLADVYNPPVATLLRDLQSQVIVTE